MSAVARIGSLSLLVASAVGFATGRGAARPIASPTVHVPVLVYHSVAPHHAGETRDQREYDVAPDVFRRQLELLRDGRIRVIPLASLVDCLERGGTIAAPSVVLTFDDGWQNQFDNAFPRLREFGDTATFFVFTNPIGRDRRWMTWDELRALAAAGMTIGSHSVTHPYLSSLSAKALADEVGRSKRVIETRLDEPVEFFAYPFGEHTAALDAAVRAAGYRAARVFGGGANHLDSDLFQLQSDVVTENMTRFRRIVSADDGARSADSAPEARVEQLHRPQNGAPDDLEALLRDLVHRVGVAMMELAHAVELRAHTAVLGVDDVH